MDYCSSCRRHLNGALACPGCGAYAPDIAPRATAAPATTGAAVWQAPADTTWFDTDTYAEEAAEEPYDGPDGAPSAPLGRAARRRQRARWKKNQRRAVVATAVALVGGGLTVASLDRQGTDRAQAATAPDNRPMGLADEQTTDVAQAAAVPTGRHRAPDTTPATGSATSNPRAQTTGPRHATPTPRQDTAASPQPAATSAAQPQSAATVSGDTVAATAAPTAATPTASATATTGTSTSPASPAPTASATSPSHLCLLVICIG
ncbi:hypothetical protein [Streptomyces sp. GbtcB6]|uniref:SCO2400 family protein n=1 Tax=Streptomyces sp. GbtcB6 TaxID=2824751 RepID=UPI001C2F4A6A|nr:hypothetical protein [Streptomyces sp. GbtcB6]